MFDNNMFNANSPIIQNLGIPQQYTYDGPPPRVEYYSEPVYNPQTQNYAIGQIDPMVSKINNQYYQPYPQPQYQQQPYQYNPYMNNNGSFYNGIYGGYNNPYLQAKQIEQYQKQQEQEMRRQSDMWKLLSRSVHKALGEDIDEEFLNHRYDPMPINKPEEEKPESKLKVKIIDELTGDVIADPAERGYYRYKTYVNEDEMVAKCARLSAYGVIGNLVNTQRILRHNDIYDKAKQAVPDSLDLYDYMEAAGPLYSQSLIDNDNYRRMNATFYYDHDDFIRTLQKASDAKSDYFNNMFKMAKGATSPPPRNLGNMEVSIPDYSKPIVDSSVFSVDDPVDPIDPITRYNEEYNRTRDAFLRSITNPGGV